MSITGLTGLVRSNPSSLGHADLVSASAVFDVVDPVGPLNKGYGVVLREGSPGGAITRCRCRCSI